MKKLYIYIAGLFLLSACTDFEIEDQGFKLEALPESVSFDGGGDGIEADDEGDEGDEVTLTVEAPNGAQADIEVTYILGGSATFGSDYTIADATEAGGTMTIAHTPGDVTNFDSGDIEIDLLNDRDNDEDDETIIITLESATRGGESIEVGRGGTEFGATATVTISDVPFVLALSASSLSSVESAVADTLTFFAELNFATDVDVTFDFNALAKATLAETTNFIFATEASSVTTGGLTIAAGETADTVQIVLVDNSTVSVTTNSQRQDSIQFNVINAAVSSGDIWVGDGESTATTEADTLTLFVRDDIKEYGFGTVATDTVSVDNVATYNYTVTLTDTLSNVASPAFANVTIPYTSNMGDATGDDFNDVTGGEVTILAGKSSANISIQVLRVNEDPEPTVTIVLGAPTTTDDAEVLGAGDNDTINIKIN